MNHLAFFAWQVPFYGYEWLPGKGRGDKDETWWMAPRAFPPGFEGHITINETSFPKWRKWRASRSKELAAALASSKPDGDQEYRPLDSVPSLFRKFAAVDVDDRNAVLSFANRYGWLGPVWPFKERGTRDFQNGIAIDYWETSIRQMSRGVALWDALSCMNESALQQWFKGLGRDRRMNLWDWPLAPFASGSVPNTVIGYAYDALEGIVNHALEDVPFRLAPTEFPIPRREVGRFSPLALFGRPNHLLAAMWLQFAFSIQGNSKFLQCPQCNEWFKPPNKASRSNVRFCSNRCRVANFRAAKRAQRKKVHQETKKQTRR